MRKIVLIIKMKIQRNSKEIDSLFYFLKVKETARFKRKIWFNKTLNKAVMQILEAFCTFQLSIFHQIYAIFKEYENSKDCT